MKRLLFLLLLPFLLSSCAESKLIFPFEADLEKHYSACMTVMEDELITSGTTFLENEYYSVGTTADDALWFYDKNDGTYYDTFGSALSSPEDALIDLCVKSESEEDISYSKGIFYDVVFERYLPTLTSFYIDNDTVRLIYLLGAEHLTFIGEYPMLITEKTYQSSDAAFKAMYREGAFEMSDINARFIENYCTAQHYYVLTGNGASADPSLVRHELLNLGYNPELSKLVFFVADISLTEYGINIDISRNRQYKTAALRTSAYSFEPFSVLPDFITITATDSDRITYAGSKY